MSKMKEMWEDRYAADAYAYGIQPNEFFKETLHTFQLKGEVLFPAEGEGRNAVYAAKNGLKTTAFDISNNAKSKALQLAKLEKVTISYEVGDFLKLAFVEKTFDAAVLIYAHFPPPLLAVYHKKIGELIKPNGLVILEGFSKNNLKYREENPAIGGPNAVEMLFSTETIKNDFPNFEIIQLEEVEVTLSEGEFHQGKGSVIRFIGRKKEF